MITRFRFGFLALVWLVTANHNDAGPTPVDAPRPKSDAANMSEHTNRLAQEKSPYLLQHAHNPVDWYPWGEDAFAKARRENKPIFLSVGYSTCHWCHVMAHESFENEDVAAIMNREFVNIKVDREERPDVDRVYMTFVQATTGSGGWPMSVWLTPDLKPFVGGTYFPPDERYGQPAFKKVLERIATAWKEDHDKIVEQGSKIVEALRESQSAARGEGKIDDSVLNAAYRQIDRSYDPKEGGFGNAPKFPRPVTLNFLTRFYARDPKSDAGKHALDMALFTLCKMAAGGMHDQIGGGREPRRHHGVGVLRAHAMDEPAVGGLLRDDRRAGVAAGQGVGLAVEPQPAALLVRAVARGAVLGQHRPDVGREVGGPGGRGGREDGRGEEGQAGRRHVRLADG